VLVLCLVPFLVKQARVALYPILEFPQEQVNPRDRGQLDAQLMPQAPAAAPEVSAMEEQKADEMRQNMLRTRALRRGKLEGRMFLGAAASASLGSYAPQQAAKTYDYRVLNQMSLDPNARVT